MLLELPLPKKAADNGEDPELEQRECIWIKPMSSCGLEGTKEVEECGWSQHYLHLPDDIPQLPFDITSSATALGCLKVGRRVKEMIRYVPQ